MLNIFLSLKSLPHLVAISREKVEIWIFQIVTWPHVHHLIKGSCGFKGGSISRQVSTEPSLVLIGLLQAETYCNVFDLSHDMTRPPRWGVMQIYSWELLAVCDQDLLRELTWPPVQRVMWIYGWKPHTISPNLAMFDCYWSSVSGDI